MQIQLPVWVLVLGRLLFVSYFVAMGSSHLLKFREHSAHLAKKHVPLPQATTVLTILMMVGGGFLVLFNWHLGLGAALLFGIILPAPFYLHRFWNETEWYSRLSEFAHLMKDISLAGAALILFVIH